MGQHGTARGFTLAETLVAIGAVAVISVGLASIFQSVGKTLTAGKRVSAFTQYATLVERQMRDDFERMTRQGFLVIHHKYAVNPAGVRIDVIPYEGATTASLRRIDEILFFATGDFASAREPMAPGAIARSGNAAIYYGHGARWPITFGAAYEFPEVNTAPPAYPQLTLGYAPSFGTPADEYPNQHATSWTLLRHVTLLSPLASTDTRYAPSGAFGYPANSNFLADQDLQVALQPASSSLFRVLSRYFPGGTGGPTIPGGMRPLRDATGAGLFGTRGERHSGLVDIATTDLSETRSLSQTLNRGDKSAQLRPEGVGSPADFTNFRTTQIADDTANPIARPGGFNLIAELTQAGIQSGSGPEADSLSNIHAWMREAFPANSFGDLSSGPDDEAHIRTRYEPEPPKYFVAASLTNELERTYRRADQLMLTSAVFVPRCSEFIVEWSLGQTDPFGRTIWYGGREPLGALDETIRLYPGSPPNVTDPDAWYKPFGYLGLEAPGASGHTLSPYLIYDFDSIDDYAKTTALAQATAHFGYVDPTWPGAGSLSDGEPPTLAWPWPKLIRVTMTLADPTDPSVEETFQFVFEVPADPKP
jgi:hypothetical protein